MQGGSEGATGVGWCVELGFGVKRSGCAVSALQVVTRSHPCARHATHLDDEFALRALSGRGRAGDDGLR